MTTNLRAGARSLRRLLRTMVESVKGHPRAYDPDSDPDRVIPLPTAQLITETDDLRIVIEAGNSGTAIVSFTGVGFGLGGMQRDEFARTMRSQSTTHTVIFVTDKRRSWYNLTHTQILDHLNRVLGDFDEVVTLGNSMGGFGALYFSGLLPRCRRAIAFAPQFSVTSDTPELRWQEWISQIDIWPVNNAIENLTPSSPAVVLFGADEVQDEWHIQAMRPYLVAPHGLFVLAGCQHNVAAALRSHRLLSPLIEQAIAGASIDDLRRLLIATGLPVVAS